MADIFDAPYSVGVSYTADAITPNDSEVFDPPYRGIHIETGGTLVFKDGRGVTKTITVPGGFYLPVLVTAVLATSTTASGFIGYP